jgi:hypothetical protein
MAFQRKKGGHQGRPRALQWLRRSGCSACNRRRSGQRLADEPLDHRRHLALQVELHALALDPAQRHLIANAIPLRHRRLRIAAERA